MLAQLLHFWRSLSMENALISSGPDNCFVCNINSENIFSEFYSSKAIAKTEIHKQLWSNLHTVTGWKTHSFSGTSAFAHMSLALRTVRLYRSVNLWEVFGSISIFGEFCFLCGLSIVYSDVSFLWPIARFAPVPFSFISFSWDQRDLNHFLYFQVMELRSPC